MNNRLSIILLCEVKPLLKSTHIYFYGLETFTPQVHAGPVIKENGRITSKEAEL